VVGDVAYGSNVQDWKFTRPDGTVFAFTTRLTDVYRKFDGRWRIVQEHGSVPVDLATLKPVLDAK
jgi:ketosteroid isomerase-like protein